MANKAIIQTITITDADEWQSLPAREVPISFMLEAAEDNEGSIRLKTTDGSADVVMAMNGWSREFHGIYPQDIEVKGAVGDKLVLTGGTW